MRILIVEDDAKLCDAIKFHLEREGYTVDICYNGEDGLHYIKQEAYNLILLDRMLPELNGIDILSQMRAVGIKTPVIITTALNAVGDRIEGLDAGADDYIVKPFDIAELLARIRAVSRRPSNWESVRQIYFGDISFDLMRYTLKGPDKYCSLSKREAELLEILMRNPNQIIPRTVLLARVWGPDAPVEDGNLDNYIHFLRRRLNSVGSNISIRTARSVGYSLEVG